MEKLSVYGLINKLVNEKARILMDPELIGTYSRISSNKRRLDIANSRWGIISGIVGNNFRANINITVEYDVEVTVPENDYGIEIGTVRTTNIITNFNIIRSGLLNIKKLAVIVSESLLDILKLSGCIRMNLLYKNSILVDLTKLPIITEEEIGKDYVNRIGKYELQNYIYKANKLLVEKIGSSHKSPYTEEEYLRNFAYSNLKYIDLKEDIKSYESKELKLYTNGFLTTSLLRSEIYAYVTYGKSNNPAITKFLDTLNKNETIDSLDKKIYDNNLKLRDIKFKLLMSGDVKNNKVIVKLPGSNKEVKISWKIKVETITIK